jgi:hypothetical protein
MNLELEIDGNWIVFRRIKDRQIPYVGYYSRYEERIIGVDTTDRIRYIAKAKLSRTGKIISISCIESV